MVAMPMATVENSVIAAASKAAKFWLARGGFKTTIINTEKIGHTHFILAVNPQKLEHFFTTQLKSTLFKQTEEITANMRNRGGGIIDIELINKTFDMAHYYQIKATFQTVDSMGANFINSCMERIGETLKYEIEMCKYFTIEETQSLQIIMNILSNNLPNCLARAEVSCPIEELNDDSSMSNVEFVKKFKQAVDIAGFDVGLATTNNKDIMKGVDCVAIATGNDFRAIEAGAHSYAAKTGKYSSLTYCSFDNEKFRFWIDLPISVGVVGGLTNIHPLVKFSLALLGRPSSKELMGIMAVSGLAQNFAALHSLVTTGIQKGHKKMHLSNILKQ